MQKFFLKRTILALVILLFALIPWSVAFCESKVPFSDIENLGSPLAGKFAQPEEIYARNIWDLQLYDGLIFLGAGNSSNRGPASNAGPVPIFYYDTGQNKFIQEGTVNEEQIDLYSVINDHLYIPGHDPTESWKLGNLYLRLENGNWLKYRSIPEALHAYAIAWYNNKMFLGLGLKDGAAVSISNDQGKTWTNIPAGDSRVYSFLQVGQKLFAIKKIKSKSYDRKNNYTGVLEFQEPDKLFPRSDLTADVLFPDVKISGKAAKKIVRATTVRDRALYIGAYTHNDHQFEPFGVFLASSLDIKNPVVMRLSLPKDALAWDIITAEAYAYILMSKTINDNAAEVIVMRSPATDLKQWEKFLSFTSPTFARSFEIKDGDFYFGLGSEVKDSRQWHLSELKPETGTLLRIRKQYIQN